MLRENAMSSAVQHPLTTARGIHRQRGVVSIIVALTVAMLIGFVGLALDLGKLYVARSELQNSADACALAAARKPGDIDGWHGLSMKEQTRGTT
jgi:uncharacterized membrane protein